MRFKAYQINRLAEYQEYFECDLELVLRMIKDGCYFKDFETGKIKRCLNVDYDFNNKEFACHYGGWMFCFSYKEYGTEIAYDREELEKWNYTN